MKLSVKSAMFAVDTLSFLLMERWSACEPSLLSLAK